MSSEGNIYYECRCHSPEHTMLITYYPEDGDMCATIFLNENPWYKRLWIAIKYVFNYKCVYGHFDEFAMPSENRDSFFNIAKKFKEFHDK